MSTITVTRDTRLDLFLVVETMITRRRLEFGRDGIRAMDELRGLDADPLTRSVALYNMVLDSAGKRQAVLVYESIDTLPRWMTHTARTRAIEVARTERAAAEREKVVDLSTRRREEDK